MFRQEGPRNTPRSEELHEEQFDVQQPVCRHSPRTIAIDGKSFLGYLSTRCFMIPLVVHESV